MLILFQGNHEMHIFTFIHKWESICLYSGIYFNRENHKYLKDQLFVFDDKGNPLQRYTLDSPIFTFTINPTTNKLYGLSDNPEFHVIEYQL